MCYNRKWRENWEASSINSMTGYGRCVRVRDGRSLTVELKSVNHRFLDISLRMPRCFLFLEDEARKAVGRPPCPRACGRILHLPQSAGGRARGAGGRGAHPRLLRATDGFAGLTDDRSVRWAFCLFPRWCRWLEAEEDREALRALLLETLEGALDEAAAMRAVEGEALQRDLNARADALEKIARAIAARAAADAHRYRERLRAQCGGNSLAARWTNPALCRKRRSWPTVWPSTKELVRLESHIAQLRALTGDPAPAGRRLDFLAQEFNREVNTIASKSQDIEITRLAMEGKAEIEKLREQVQNVE